MDGMLFKELRKRGSVADEQKENTDKGHVFICISDMM